MNKKRQQPLKKIYQEQMTTKLESSFSKKRKAKINQIDTRHIDKMARLDRFNDLFEKFFEKL
jgi:hypothetical protein